MLLSIIIPVYNEEITIIQILKKVNSQKKKLNLEVIVSNDGSNDKTIDIIKKSKIRYLAKKKNLGILVIAKVLK